MAWLERWVAFWDRREAPASLALTRVLVGAALLTDLLQAKYAGAVELLWSAPPLGMAWGATGDRLPLAARWLGATPQTAELLWGLAVLCAALFMLGAFYRVTAVLLAIALGQIGRCASSPIPMPSINYSGSRCSRARAVGCQRHTFTADAWLHKKLSKPYQERVPAWPRYLLILQLLWMYFSAAHNRGDSAWYPHGGFAAISNVMSDPHFARYAPGTFHGVYRLTQLGTAAMMLFEGSAPLMLLWLWLDRGPL